MNQFDKLVKEAQTMSFEEGWKKVWTEVFSLKKILIAIQKPTDGESNKEPLLYLGTLNESSCVFAFSDKEHYDTFKKHVIKEGDKRIVDYRSLSIQEFLNFSQHTAHQNVPTILFNYMGEVPFHTNSKDIVSMFRTFMKGNHLQEHRVEEGTMIRVAVPDELTTIKHAIEQIKGNYVNVLNNVYPIIVNLDNRVDLTFVMDFKGGLPEDIKKSVIQNFYHELSLLPASNRQLYFTEDKNIIPPEMKNILQVKI